MASNKQIAANQRNAQLSTGPNTPAGKAKSRLNAIRDNITGQIVTLSPADRAAFEKLRDELVTSLDPQTALERNLANDVAWDSWRVNHIRAVESNIFALGLEESMATENMADAESNIPTDLDIAFADANTFRSQPDRFDRMSLYEQRMNRTLQRNLATLRDLQAERKRLRAADKHQEVTLARMNEIDGAPIQPSPLPSENGFVFSDEEIAHACVRERRLETAAHRFRTAQPAALYGELVYGFPDSYLTMVDCKYSEKLRAITKSLGESVESLTRRRTRHPEEFDNMRPAPVPAEAPVTQ